MSGKKGFGIITKCDYYFDFDEEKTINNNEKQMSLLW